MRKTILIATTTAAAFATVALATSHVSIETMGAQTCITSNGTPDHAVGQFPNQGNPHHFRPQNLEFCFDAQPTKGKTASTRARTVGIAKNGIPIRPGTADWFDAQSPRGHSRNPASGWNLEGMGPDNTLGLDQNNAHVDHRGLYHYHGMPTDWLSIDRDTVMGYAADGFEIHYVGDQAQSSYVLKSGTRPSAPFGDYDGSYEQDYSFAAGSGNLDRCNGGEVAGKYVYFTTDTYPFFPRCHWGVVSADFTQAR